MSVQVVQYFNGNEVKVFRTARTNNGAKQAIRACSAGGGWGVKLRGTVDQLKAIGAEQNEYKAWIFALDRHTNRFYDCVVVGWAKSKL